MYRGAGVLDGMTPPGHWENARENFRKSVECCPANASSLYLLGQAELELGETEKAVTLMNRAMILDMDFRGPYVNLGVAYLRLGQWEKAIEVSEGCLKRHPDSPQCVYHIAVACYQLLIEKRKKGRDKIEDLERLRTKAGLLFKEARDTGEAQSRRSGAPFTDEDDKMVASLNPRGAIDKIPEVELEATVGWRFLQWRN